MKLLSLVCAVACCHTVSAHDDGAKAGFLRTSEDFKTHISRLKKPTMLAVSNGTNPSKATILGIYGYGIKDVISRNGGVFKEFDSEEEMKPWLERAYPGGRIEDYSDYVGKAITKQLSVRDISKEEHPLITCHTVEISAQEGDERFSDEGYYNMELINKLASSPKFLKETTKAFCHTSPNHKGYTPTFEVTSLFYDNTQATMHYECHGPSKFLTKAICHALQVAVFPK